MTMLTFVPVVILLLCFAVIGLALRLSQQRSAHPNTAPGTGATSAQAAAHEMETVPMQKLGYEESADEAEGAPTGEQALRGRPAAEIAAALRATVRRRTEKPRFKHWDGIDRRRKGILLAGLGLGGLGVVLAGVGITLAMAGRAPTLIPERSLGAIDPAPPVTLPSEPQARKTEAQEDAPAQEGAEWAQAQATLAKIDKALDRARRDRDRARQILPALPASVRGGARDSLAELDAHVVQLLAIRERAQSLRRRMQSADLAGAQAATQGLRAQADQAGALAEQVAQGLQALQRQRRASLHQGQLRREFSPF